MKILIGSDHYTINDLAMGCGGKCFGANRRIEAICTDSREADAKTLFVALRGERVDGHSYIPTAMAAGCCMFLCEKIVGEVPENASFVVVSDTLAALSMIAHAYLKDLTMLRIGVTGSVGKTTTKEFLAAVLSRRYCTFKSEANYNSTIGMPLMALGVSERHEAAVFEMGMSARGEIEQLSGLLAPNIAVITNVGTAHLEYLGSRENIAKAKMEIVNGLEKGGYLFLDGDEPLLSVPVRADVHIRTVSMRGKGDFCLENIVLHPDTETTTFDLRCAQGVFQDIVVPGVGEHIAYDAAIAVAVGVTLDMENEKIREGLLCREKQKMRQHPETIHGVTILDDSYNASPESVRQALRVLTSYAKERGGRAIAVLGDMRELGNDARLLHEEVGAYLKDCGVDYLLTLGDLGTSIAEGALGAGMEEDAIVMWRQTDTFDGAVTILANWIKKNDVILVKASRAVAAERLITALKAYFDNFD